MKKLELPAKLLTYMAERGKFVFVDDFSGWGKESELKHFKRASVMEGNKLVAENGQEFELQSVSIRKGNHLTVNLRDHEAKTYQDLKLADLPIFQDFEVVIITGSESLYAFAPVCNNKFELAIFLQNLADYGDPKDYELSRIKYEMACLAKFLYKNNPDKTKSILDDLD